ncbi:PTS sugar transporter subunit IIA [Neorhizobium sp. T786]|uniref:PTS sugar transporter subunit IIA n=1 Tax=Pseudorhizobium xiangyangii TaxID=2883104 RepID=UPI001D000C82|nr:PTS sugar transporter subunit IIA [Neorhizobium xiangyangii]MCB5204012.1 PTS sugar transporter subunit IIA [Neorhizobium xiangyangii]
MQLSDYLSPEDIVIDLAFNSKKDLLARLADLASKRCNLGRAGIAHALTDREGLGLTGIAIPHAIIDGLDKSVCMFVRLSRPLDFEAVDEISVDLIALLSPPDMQQQCLNILSCIARRLRSDRLNSAVRTARTAEEAYILLIATDGNIGEPSSSSDGGAVTSSNQLVRQFTGTRALNYHYPTCVRSGNL